MRCCLHRVVMQGLSEVPLSRKGVSMSRRDRTFLPHKFLNVFLTLPVVGPRDQSHVDLPPARAI